MTRTTPESRNFWEDTREGRFGSKLPNLPERRQQARWEEEKMKGKSTIKIKGNYGFIYKRFAGILLGIVLCTAGFSEIISGQEIETASGQEMESAASEQTGIEIQESSEPEVQILDPSLSGEEMETYFQAREISEGDEIYDRISGKSYRENDHIALGDLRYLTLLHYNFDHQIQVGEMIVNEAAAEDVLDIFRELFGREYEIQSVFLIDDYWTGDPDTTDTASTMANNTSCFNYREITGGGSLSNHALGLAIDINPLQNPYAWYDEEGNLQCLDENAVPYLDRTSGDPHVIVEGDVCWSIFHEYGFTWGGSWNNPVDYQHFEREEEEGFKSERE